MNTCYFCHLPVGAYPIIICRKVDDIDEVAHEECLEAAAATFKYDPGEKARRLS